MVGVWWEYRIACCDKLGILSPRMLRKVDVTLFRAQRSGFRLHAPLWDVCTFTSPVGKSRRYTCRAAPGATAVNAYAALLHELSSQSFFEIQTASQVAFVGERGGLAFPSVGWQLRSLPAFSNFPYRSTIGVHMSWGVLQSFPPPKCRVRRSYPNPLYLPKAIVPPLDHAIRRHHFDPAAV